MKKTFQIIILVALLSTAAFADDNSNEPGSGGTSDNSSEAGEEYNRDLSDFGVENLNNTFIQLPLPPALIISHSE